MKKLLFSCVMLLAGTSVQGAVGDDITGKYLKNADFSQDTPVEGRICTYDYDMEKGGYTLYGQQAVTGWTAPTLSDNTNNPDRKDDCNARAAGVFAIGAYDDQGNHKGELGGAYYAPDSNSSGQEGTGNVLGMVAVWGSRQQYTQSVTLPAGAYTIQIPVWNAGGTGDVAANLCGFIAEGGKAFVVNRTSWDANSEWMTDEVTFVLDEPTTGVISLGYTADPNKGSGSMPHLFFDYIKIIEADASAVIKAQIDAVKEEQLLPLIEAGKELGVDVSASQAVYDNPNATMEQVLQAIEDQKAANASKMTDFTDFFISNAHFTIGTPLDNGVCTYAKDKDANSTPYSGMQPIPSWTPNAPDADGIASGLFAVGSGETAWLGAKGKGFVPPATKANGETQGNVFGLVSCWEATAYYSQQVTLPAGSYTITIPTYNSAGGTTAIAKNLCGFIGDNGEEYLAETTVFPINKWTKETIKFTLEEETSGIISIGYTASNNVSGSMPHLFIDEFTLTFNGVTDVNPSLVALRGAITNAKNTLQIDDPYERALQTELEKAINDGQKLVDAQSADVESNTAAATSINNIIRSIRTSIDKYAKLHAFIEGEMTDAINRYNGTHDMQDFAGQLASDKSEYLANYESGTYTAQQIDDIITAFNGRVKEAVKNAFDAAVAAGDGGHNVDITPIIAQNLSFSDMSIEGWQFEGTSGKLASQQSGVVEVWGTQPLSFTAYTVIDNLPAGVYRISAPGFYRSGSITANYEAYANEEPIKPAYLFAGGNRVKLHNQAEMAAVEPDHLHNTTVGDVYLPNGQAMAQALFYYSNDYDLDNTVLTVLHEDGSLTIGTTADNLDDGGSWVCWGALTITYLGHDADIASQLVNEELTSLIEKASVLGANDYVTLIDEACNKLDKAVEAGEDAIESTAMADKLAAVEALKSSIEYAGRCESVLNKWIEICTLYQNIKAWADEDGNFLSNDKTLQALLDRDPEDGAYSIEEAEQIIASFPKAWSNYVFAQDGVAAATENNPFDVSYVIVNNSFEKLDEDGIGLSVWNVESMNNDTGIRSNETNTYMMEGSDGHYLFNTWDGPNRGYAIGQDVFLPEGYYTLKCTVAGDADKTIRMHAGEAISELTFADGKDEEGNSVASKTLGQEIMLVFGSKGETINLGLSTTNAWYKADNFQLFYMGTAAPAGIDEVTATAPIARSGIYDLSGRRVGKVQKGLYIIDGKKVIVK